MSGLRAFALIAVIACAACTPKPSKNGNGNGNDGGSADAGAHTRIDGHDFPDHVIALTWDDGPDAHTAELAQLLYWQRVSATFFVVAEWNKELSEEPGEGIDVFHTGHRALPILGRLVALGHRIGNHTTHHHLLTNASRDLVRSELLDNQREIAPFQKNELPLFRAPGGYFDENAAAAIKDTSLVGPVHWDIDGKDWEGSLYPRGARVKPAVIAARYLEAIEHAGHGIVLLHDRVGDVGSTYALDVAKILVPALVEKGFVFAAPVLRFSAFAERSVRPAPGPDRLEGDLNGDGRPDRCRRVDTDIRCALAATAGSFTDERTWASRIPNGALVLMDVNGDGRVDLCLADGRCALAP